tara:strand:+ start:757 stop:1458 length:702 start_codon:yes stop_codon:yes gene_type:complete
MSTGWVKLHRQLLGWEWYNDVNTTRVFLHLLLVANHKDNNWRGIEIKRGQRLTSVNALASETNLSIKNIRTSIKRLKSTNEVASHSTAQHTVFTMVNYDLYQDEASEVANKGQAKGKQRATNNNDKNDKNENNNNIHQQIADSWNDIFKDELSAVSKVTQKRISAINGCINEMKGTVHDFSKIETWTNLFLYVKSIPFLMGGNDRGWTISFDFITTKSKLIKLVEGEYEYAVK